ncbi:MAG: hypothetical protein NZO58_10805, partial [Gemmataceae bacterium]|nr:hypothetical protein [Gemmataceae bacterium]
DDRAAAVAKQAILTLLLETAVDPKTQARTTAAPETFVNRLAASGLLCQAILELPRPAQDLLQEAERLAHYVRLQQQADGSFAVAGDTEQAKAEASAAGVGPALAALMRGYGHQPAAWRLDAVRKACTYYHPWWRDHKTIALLPDLTAAFTEAYLVGKDAALANAVFEMADWLCTLQYTNADPLRPHWTGGFQSVVGGKARPTPPELNSTAAAASCLVHACRAAYAAGEVQRLARYRAALESAVSFVAALQYTEANTEHFTDGFRQHALLGGFFASHHDGDLRLEGQYRALAALVAYLRHLPQ